MGRRTPPRPGTITMPELTEQEVKELMGTDYLPPPPGPRIRVGDSRNIIIAGNTLGDLSPAQQAVAKIEALYAWAEQNDPKPARWKWRARREWRTRWGLT